ncbi:MAG: hypothetical protein M0Z46_12460 [Actinomycetota bacterium]|nr:hypothetical protein [Actinomycetota bacterium]
MIAWGSTAANSAVNGLAALLLRDEWRNHPDGERIRRLLVPHLDSPDETVRMLATTALPQLVDHEGLIKALCNRLSRETSGSVIEVLIGTLAHHVASDPEGIDSCLGHLATLPAWSVLAAVPEDRSVPPNHRRTDTGDLLIQVLLYLALHRTTPFAMNLLLAWRTDPKAFPATIGRLVLWSRPYLNPPGGIETVSQSRAFDLLTYLADACVDVTSSAEKILSSGTALNDDQRQDVESAARIAYCIARELYHASGAFQTQQEQAQPDHRIVSPSFCTRALAIMEKLAAVRAAGIAHHLVQTLVFLSRREPRRVFLLVAKIATPGSGYENEALGETEVLDLVDLYLAERREIVLDDPKCLSGLRQILETFVAVGSDRAIRRVQDLGELFA